MKLCFIFSYYDLQTHLLAVDSFLYRNQNTNKNMSINAKQLNNILFIGRLINKPGQIFSIY
jgi:hypothetical protein